MFDNNYSYEAFAKDYGDNSGSLSDNEFFPESEAQLGGVKPKIDKVKLTSEDIKKETKKKKTTKKHIIKCKCKPTYNFQSIEFEWELDLDDGNSICNMFDLYDDLLENLQLSAPVQPTAQKKEEVVEDPATEKQLQILNKFKIKHSPNVSKREANELIQKSMRKQS